MLLRRQVESGQSSTDYDSLAVAAQLPSFAGAVQNSPIQGAVLWCCSAIGQPVCGYSDSTVSGEGASVSCRGSHAFLSGPVC